MTFSTLFGLIAMTGLRIGEALALDREDVDLDQGVLTIRRGKLGRARLVPIHASVAAHLHTYAGERDRLLGFTPRSFFATDRGNRPHKATARYNFAQICKLIGLRKTQQYGRHGCGPRIHDLRHSFAARTMIDWYRAGADPTREMLKLTTYLGHTTPESTYWYIEAVPELLELAARRVTDSADEETAQ
jgi:integrase